MATITYEPDDGNEADFASIAPTAIPSLSDIITCKEAAELLGLGKSRVSQLVREGRLRRLPISGRTVLLSRAEVLAWEPGPVGRPRAERGENG